MERFDVEAFLPASVWARLIDVRIQDPERSLRGAKMRRRRQTLAPDGKLNILAADHPARRVTAIGENPLGMCDRRDYLARILRALMSGVVDGVMATMDILEDLFVLGDFLREAGGPALLNEKVLVASLNRGGLAGASWEIDDPITGAGPATCAAWALDGAKILLRVCDDEPRSLATLLASARAISELNALGFPVFLEPLPVRKTESGYQVVKTAEALARIAGVASALGDSSRRLWLKLPYCEDYAVVARATSLPILILGGEASGDGSGFLGALASAMSAGPNVRGALAGRNVLYPGEDDPLVAATAVGAIVHLGLPVNEALEAGRACQGESMHWPSPTLGSAVL